MGTSSLERLTAILVAFRQYKELYVHPVTIETVQIYLHAFRTGYSASTACLPETAWWDAQQRRGWKRRAAGPVAQMKAKGMSDEAIMDELIEIELEILRPLSAG